ncbi:ABC transporter permease [Rhodanobacter denitrificans]|uniref:ABC transporter permease n=1 Tax=Rhodanobacter denitrificans TaxID=666685 RepID=UPI000260C845|nr:ABC transporter permease [Rhodanobacter denitrificans]EIM01136.1 antimicrobial peptide ABC transporter permease [Rhodanobacter denitrificans]UJM89546.1 ABC transporter permease [Rhodanobacter denitrificans]
MNVYPILVALRRHKAAVILIVLQIALTLAIVANAFFIIGHTMARMSRTSGLDEDGLIFIWQKLPVVTGDAATIIEKIDAMQRADLQAIRNLPDVQDATATASFPLLQGDGEGDISLDADRQGKFVHAAYYYGDEHLRGTFGARLIAGRDFFASEIRHGQTLLGSKVIIVSKALADQLFPSGNALGQAVYQDGKLTTIVGIVERLRIPNMDDSNWADNSVIEPLRQDGFWTGYVVRARNGRTTEAMRDIHKALFALDPMRHMPPGAGVHPVTEMRASYYDDERGVALLMGVICIILLSVTAAGIVGLTSFWVGQRHRQIGVRRALGARKIDILLYFQIENLLIAGGGGVIGALCAVGLNVWLMKHYEMMHLPVFYVAMGVLAMLVLGQAAVLMPARRASNVPPVVATRSV